MHSFLKNKKNIISILLFHSIIVLLLNTIFTDYAEQLQYSIIHEPIETVVIFFVAYLYCLFTILIFYKKIILILNKNTNKEKNVFN